MGALMVLRAHPGIADGIEQSGQPEGIDITGGAGDPQLETFKHAACVLYILACVLAFLI